MITVTFELKVGSRGGYLNWPEIPTDGATELERAMAKSIRDKVTESFQTMFMSLPETHSCVTCEGASPEFIEGLKQRAG